MRGPTSAREMKKPKAPRFTGELGEQIKETTKEGKEQVSLGKAFEELLSQIFGGAKPPSKEKMEEIKKEEEEQARLARAKVLEQFMGPPEDTKEERVYYQKQKEEAMKKIEKQKEAQKKVWEAGAAAPKGKKQRGSLFESLRRKVTQTERKGGKF